MICEKCKADVNSIVIHKNELWCWGCHNASKGTPNTSSMINTDDIPGGLLVKNGICNEDGSPKRYYSKSEIMRAAYEKNLTVGDNTPKPNPRIVEQEHAQREARNRR